MREDEDDLPELDYTDPLKRDADEDDSPGGLDPIITIPPED
jgi:hypothetical protein